MVSSNHIDKSSSMLIVVGRDDTGELEAQVRGSRHAWDIRLLSAWLYYKLLQPQRNADDTATGQKIRDISFPMEYTRLDRIIDVMFTTVTDVEPALNPESEVPLELSDEDLPHIIRDKGTAKKIDKVHPEGTWEFTNSRVLQQKRLEILQSVSQSISSPLIRKSRALYWSASHDNIVACSISKRYARTELYRYWYAFHPQWDEFLREGKIGLLVLGCMDQPFVFCIPWNIRIRCCHI